MPVNQRTVLVVVPGSPGCRVDAMVLREALQPLQNSMDLKVRVVVISAEMESARPEQIARGMPLENPPDVVIFVEGILPHPVLMGAKHRLLLPNPEWLTPQRLELAAGCTRIWHKSRFSLQRLAGRLPGVLHRFLGFTSQDPGWAATGSRTFLHPRGKIHTRRNTSVVISSWEAHPHWPDLHVQWHDENLLGIDCRRWFSSGNIHLRSCWLDRKAYLSVVAEHAIHLCTSESEGFGHAINEARALGRLVVTTDAPPMNELIDATCGVLVSPSAVHPYREGVCAKLDIPVFSEAIERVLSLDQAAISAMGLRARQRFEAERDGFRRTVLAELSEMLA